MENEGLQDLAETRSLIHDTLAGKIIPPLRANERATVQTMSCLREMEKRRIEMNNEAPRSYEALSLTVSLIIDLHKTLMKDLITFPGSFRTSDAFPGGKESFRYLAPEKIESALESLLDTYNEFVSVEQLSLENTMKVTAWFLFHFLTIHPFSDGNGRLSRVLDASILFIHIDKLVSLRPFIVKPESAAEDFRAIYINAIETCRIDTVGPCCYRPSDLFSLVIESAWRAHAPRGVVADDDISSDSGTTGFFGVVCYSLKPFLMIFDTLATIRADTDFHTPKKNRNCLPITIRVLIRCNCKI